MLYQGAVVATVWLVFARRLALVGFRCFETRKLESISYAGCFHPLVQGERDDELDVQFAVSSHDSQMARLRI